MKYLPWIISVSVTSFVWWVIGFSQSLGPLPYINATIEVEQRTADYVDLAFNFEKLDDCSYVRMSFVGETLGAAVPLSHEDLDGEKGTTRQPGSHQLLMRVYTAGADIESVKAYTRHDCLWREEMKTVDRKFGEVDIPPAPEKAVPVQSTLEEQRAIIEDLQQQIETLSEGITK
jgi:hypothetical protein